MRQDLVLDITVLEGTKAINLVGVPVPNASYTYEFNVTSNHLGNIILDIKANGEEIGQSPLRVEISPANCARHSDDNRRIPDVEGNCICRNGTIEIGSRCIAITVLLMSIFIPAILISTFLGYVYLEHKRKQGDSIWAVKPSELRFDNPPVVVGRGTFGLVLLAEYRGTKVAVKRVIPPRVYLGKSALKKRSLLGEGDTIENEAWVNKSVAVWSQNSSDRFDHGNVHEAIAMESGFLSSSQTSRMKVCHHTSESTSGSVFSSSSTVKKKKWSAYFLRRGGEYARLKSDFIAEMRQLSKLRHPCITTVMGAVIAKGEEPMLVMEYMNHGSLVRYNSSLSGTFFCFDSDD